MNIVLFRVSKDGGYTWGDWKERPLGEVGEYAKKATIGPLGRSRQFVVQIRVTDPIRADMIAGSATLEPYT